MWGGDNERVNSEEKSKQRPVHTQKVNELARGGGDKECVKNEGKAKQRTVHTQKLNELPESARSPLHFVRTPWVLETKHRTHGIWGR